MNLDTMRIEEQKVILYLSKKKNSYPFLAEVVCPYHIGDFSVRPPGSAGARKGSYLEQVAILDRVRRRGNWMTTWATIPCVKLLPTTAG